MRDLNIALILAITVAGAHSASAASFTGGYVLPDGATAIAWVTDGTPDGTTIVGKYEVAGDPKKAFRMDGTDFTVLDDLPASVTEAKAVAGDASIVVGKSEEGGKHAVYWDEDDDIVVLTTDKSEAKAVNFDGSVIVGKTKPGATDTAVKWIIDGSGGIIEMILSDFLGGKSEARGVSDDGDWVVGKGLNALGEKVALRWDASGVVTEIGDLIGGKGDAVANDVSSDGSVVVGVADTDGGKVAFRWDSSSGIEALGDLGGGKSEATGVSADGSIIVGVAHNGTANEAFIWTQADGMRGLMEYLITEYGLGPDLIGWTLNSAAISADGRTVIGLGTNGGQEQIFTAQIPEPSTYAMLVIGLVGLGWIGRRRK